MTRDERGLHARRGAVVGLIAAAMLALSGCWGWSAPVSEPGTPEPVSVTPTPVAPDALELLAEHCGQAWDAPVDAFTAELRRPSGVLPAGMTIQLGLRIELEAEHGRHAVDAWDANGVVLDDAGQVVGLVVAFSVPGTGTSSGVAVSMPVYLAVGACPDGDVGLGDPLPDGSYSLVLSGPLRPTDHDHAVGEHWLTNELAFEVTGGEIAP